MSIWISTVSIHNDHVVHNGDTYRVIVTMRRPFLGLRLLPWRIGRITVIGTEHAIYDRKSAPRWLGPVVDRMLEAWADR